MEIAGSLHNFPPFSQNEFFCLVIVIIIGVIAVKVVVDKVKIRGTHLLVAWLSPSRSGPLRAFDNGAVQLAHAGFQQILPSAGVIQPHLSGNTLDLLNRGIAVPIHKGRHKSERSIVAAGREDGQPIQKRGDTVGLLSYRTGDFLTDNVPYWVGLTGIVLSVQPQFRIAAQECGNALVVLFGPLTQASDEGLGKAE